MEVGSIHSLRCYNSGGHHKARKCMEQTALLTEVQSQSGAGHTSGRTGTQNMDKKVNCSIRAVRP